MLNERPLMKVSTRKILFFFLKALSLLGLVLVISWLSLPYWISPLIQSQLPKQWTLTQLNLPRPTLSHWTISAIELQLPQGHKIQAFNVQIQHAEAGQWHFIIPKVNVILNSSSPAIQNSTQADSNFPSMSPFTVPVNLDIQQLKIIAQQDMIAGEVHINANAFSFEGIIQSQKLGQYDIDVNMLGLDGNKPLQLSIKSGTQFFNLHYPWSKQQNDPNISLDFLLADNLISLINKQWLQRQFPGLQMDNPSIAGFFEIAWQSWPQDLSQLLEMATKNPIGKFELDFDRLEFMNYLLKKNHIQFEIQQKNNDLVIINTTFKNNLAFVLPLNTLLNQQTSSQNVPKFAEKMQIKLPSKTPIVVELSPTQLVLQSPIKIHASYASQQLYLLIQTLKLNLETLQIQMKSQLDATLSPQMMKGLPQLNHVPDFTLKTLVELNFSPGLTVNMKFMNTLIQVKNHAWQNLIQTEDLQFTLAPFNLDINPNQLDFNQLLEHLILQGEIKGQLLLDKIRGKISSHWQLLNGKLRASTELENHSDKILMSLNSTLAAFFDTTQPTSAMNIQTNAFAQAISVSLSSEQIQLTNWPIPRSLIKNLEISQGTMDFNLSANLTLQEMTLDNILKKYSTLISKDSTINIQKMKLRYEKFKSENISLRLSLDNNGLIVSHLVHASLSTASGLSTEILESILNQITIAPERIGDINVKLNIFGGQLSITHQKYDSQHPLQIVKIHLEHLDLQQLFAWLDIEGLSVTGSLAGDIPLTITQTGYSIFNAQLNAIQDGTLAYQPRSAPKDMTQQNIALQALQNFHYRQLNLTLNYSEQGDYQISSRILGANPELYNGYPVALNPTLKGHLPNLFWALFVSGKFEDDLVQKIHLNSKKKP